MSRNRWRVRAWVMWVSMGLAAALGLVVLILLVYWAARLFAAA